MKILQVLENESQQQFIDRFVANGQFPEVTDQAVREKMATSFWTNRELANSVEAWFPEKKCRFIEPGLVLYQDLNDGKGALLLLRKPALDRIAPTYVGKPIVNQVHRKVRPSDYKDGKADGIVTRTWYNPEDGWFWASFIPFNQSTAANADSEKFFVSCSYLPTVVNEDGGYHHDIEYHGEILDGVGTHIAIVANPRYEGAYITNTGGNEMAKWKFWKKDKDAQGQEVMNASELDDSALIDVGNGKRVPVKSLVDLHNASEGVSLPDDVEIELQNGTRVSVKQLRATYERHNAAEEAEKKKKEDEEKNNAAHNSGGHKSRLDNCGLCNSEKEKEEKDKKEKEERENSSHFRSVEEAAGRATNSGAGAPAVLTRDDGMAQGIARYGSAKK